MGEDNVHGCLICHAEFADSLQFYEHVMEHADAQSGDDEVDDLPGHDPTPAELPESNEQDGYLAASSEVYSKCPTSPVPLFTPFPANFVGGPSVSTVYQMQPPGNFAARYVAYPQHMSAGRVIQNNWFLRRLGMQVCRSAECFCYRGMRLLYAVVT